MPEWVFESTPFKHARPIPLQAKRIRLFQCHSTRSPYTTGELVPQPGSFTDQRMFSVLLQRMGSFLPSATPSAFGPLQRGQLLDASCENADDEPSSKSAALARIRFIRSPRPMSPWFFLVTADQANG